MTNAHRQELIEEARKCVSDQDISHDFLHAHRVLLLAEKIGRRESGDLDILVPAALFHDVVNYPKNDPRSKLSSIHSAKLVRRILARKRWYPKAKIPTVADAIERCSFSKCLPKERLEEHILQDADLLESTGAISVARTFASSGQLKRPFYDAADPAARHRKIIKPLTNALDLFPSRLSVASQRLHTKTAKKLARRRDLLLRVFYREFLRDIRP